MHFEDTSPFWSPFEGPPCDLTQYVPSRYMGMTFPAWLNIVYLYSIIKIFSCYCQIIEIGLVHFETPKIILTVSRW